MVREFQPTLPARGATIADCAAVRQRQISTHAPRTGSDLPAQDEPITATISTHAPRTGSDRLVDIMADVIKQFQPTLPARGATPRGGRTRRRNGDFNPRSPHGERRDRDWLANFARQFQPTLPARGATHRAPDSGRLAGHFNPRSPHGERLRRRSHPLYSA